MSGGVTDAPRAHALVVVVCGIPGAGKTTACEALRQHLLAGSSPTTTGRGDEADPARRVDVTHVCFDAFVAPPPDAEAEGFSPEAWERARKDALGAIARALDRSPQTCTAGFGRVVLVDDTMHYRSMRREVQRIAGRCEAAYLQVFVDAPLDVALARNAQRRSRPVGGSSSLPRSALPDAVVARAFSALERPDVDPWGAIVIPASDGATFDAAAVWDALNARWGPATRFVSPEEEAARLRAARDASAASQAHQLDCALRREITEAAAAMRAQGASRAAIAAQVAAMNAARKQRMVEAKRKTKTHEAKGER